VKVVLYGKSEFAAHGAKLDEADVAEFGAAHSKISEAEGEVGGFVDFSEEPGALGVGGEDLTTGLKSSAWSCRSTLVTKRIAIRTLQRTKSGRVRSDAFSTRYKISSDRPNAGL
jgi:hypothetical protein